MMELQLGLALPTHTTFFDLNKIGSYGVEEMADFDGTYEEGDSGVAGKIEDESSRTRTMSLLVWPGQPNEEDDRCPRKVPCSFTTKKGEEEEDQVIVGWPPIKTWRKKIVSQQQQVEAVMNVGANGEGGHPGQNMVSNGNSGGRSNFVKVKMQGVAIARKIDVSLYHSYQPLFTSLIHMFSLYHKYREDGHECYTLIYQDMEGDWMLVRDVPWQTFISTVHRLEIRRSSGSGTTHGSLMII